MTSDVSLHDEGRQNIVQEKGEIERKKSVCKTVHPQNYKAENPAQEQTNIPTHKPQQTQKERIHF